MSIPGLRVPAGFGPWPLVIGCPSPPHVRRRGLGYVASSLGVNRLFRGVIICVSVLFLRVKLLFKGVNRLFRGI